jgi:pimeloyl-ACP methyl ester carboxylesterase
MKIDLSRWRRQAATSIAAVIAVVVVAQVRRYRRDLAAACDRLAGVDRRVVDSRFGAVEYAECGVGQPVLVAHGILHGCDGGLVSVRDTVTGRRVIAPSRFGYLGSDLPAGATPADQADAFAELLDHLGLDQVDVIGISAGTTAALQFALRHPGRVGHLVVMSGSWPGSPTAVEQPAWARFAYADVPLWTLRAFAPSTFNRLLGVPAGFPRNAAEAREVSELGDSIFPVHPRAKGATFDALVSNPDVNRCPLEAIQAPTLVVHSRDDPLTSYDAAARAAERIPRARLVTMETGGHLGLGQTAQTREELDRFLTTPITAM